MKKRILFLGEASSLNSGFSTIYRELIPRLCEKYEVAEVACYVAPGDPKQEAFVNGRWKWWGTMPRNPIEAAEFNKPSPHPEDRGQNINQFGYAVFDKACAEFKPDIVVSIRDVWMDSFVSRSPFRSWFKWIYMPTIDCQYQAEEWLDVMSRANLICSYSDFGVETLRLQAPGLKVFKKPLRPGVDLDIFHPMNRKSIRDEFMLNPDIKVVGSVFRNQSRKRSLDLIDSFAIMKNKHKDNPEVDKSVLLIHSCWPDNQFSFDYPRHIMRLNSSSWMQNHCPGIKNSVLQTLKCHACGKPSLTFAANLFNKPVVNGAILFPCTHCGQNAASTPNVGNGLSREDLAKIYNLMDLLVQFTIAEGDGMPAQEAKACEVPILVTGYSAFKEKGSRKPDYKHLEGVKDYTVHLGGELIDVDRYYVEPETSALRALTSIEDGADKMFKLITSDLSKMKADARKCVEDNYDWNKNVKDWDFILENVKSVDRTKTWDTPVQEHKGPNTNPPDGLTDEGYVNWLYLNVLCYEREDTNNSGIWVEHLKRGTSRADLLKHFLALGHKEQEPARLRDEVRKSLVITNEVREWI